MVSKITCAFFMLFLPSIASTQTAAPSTGDITVRLSQGLDSATARPNQLAAGSVIKSTNPAVAVGVPAGVLLVSEQSGEFSVHLVRLSTGGQFLRTASSSGVLAGVSKLGGFLHDANAPKTASSGPRVYLPANTDIRFTLSDAPPQPAAPPVRQARAPMPPPPPRHPANTVLDVPAAAPEYPAMHATHPAQENCWWIPYVSTKWGFEAPLETCENKETNIRIVETATGLSILLHDATGPQSDFLTVENKAADQPIETAIRQQFIMKLKVPAARTSCKVQKGDSVGSAESYTVAATGSYSKLKKFQGTDDGDPGEDPCPGLTMDDAVARSFLYLPNETKAHFFFIQEEDYGASFNHDAMRYPSKDGQ